jgi:hypothetical protein
MPAAAACRRCCSTGRRWRRSEAEPTGAGGVSSTTRVRARGHARRKLDDSCVPGCAVDQPSLRTGARTKSSCFAKSAWCAGWSMNAWMRPWSLDCARPITTSNMLRSRVPEQPTDICCAWRRKSPAADAADRVTKVTYPDSTFAAYTSTSSPSPRTRTARIAPGPTPTTPTGGSPASPIPPARRRSSATTTTASL